MPVERLGQHACVASHARRADMKRGGRPSPRARKPPVHDARALSCRGASAIGSAARAGMQSHPSAARRIERSAFAGSVGVASPISPPSVLTKRSAHEVLGAPSAPLPHPTQNVSPPPSVCATPAPLSPGRRACGGASSRRSRSRSSRIDTSVYARGLILGSPHASTSNTSNQSFQKAAPYPGEQSRLRPADELA